MKLEILLCSLWVVRNNILCAVQHSESAQCAQHGTSAPPLQQQQLSVRHHGHCHHNTDNTAMHNDACTTWWPNRKWDVAELNWHPAVKILAAIFPLPPAYLFLIHHWHKKALITHKQIYLRQDALQGTPPPSWEPPALQTRAPGAVPQTSPSGQVGFFCK